MAMLPLLAARRPLGPMVAERHRRPAPVRRRFGQLHDRPQVPDAAVRRVHLREQRRELFGRKLVGSAAPDLVGERSAIDDPFARRARARPAPPSSHLLARDARAPPSRRTPSGSRSRSRSPTPAGAAACRPRPMASAMPLTDCTMLSNPRRSRHGPVPPHALSDTQTIPGRRFASACGENPRAASAPGRYDCENTSASRASARRASTPSGVRRSRRAESLPMPVSSSTRPESGRCAALIFSTSAPCSARLRAQVGPASTRVRSSTRTPASGRAAGGSGSGGASPMRSISRSG